MLERIRLSSHTSLLFSVKSEKIDVKSDSIEYSLTLSLQEDIHPSILPNGGQTNSLSLSLAAKGSKVTIAPGRRMKGIAGSVRCQPAGQPARGLHQSLFSGRPVS